MIKKTGMIIGLLLFIITSGYSYSLHAEVTNVKDCLDQKEDCQDLDEMGSNEPDQSETDTEIVKSDGLLIIDLAKMVVSLLLVLGLIYILLKFLGKRNKHISKTSALENLGGISFGPNKSIQIIRIGEKFYLIGVGDNVEMLHEITDEKIIEDLLDNDGADLNTNNLLKSLSLFRRGADKGESATDSKTNDFKQLFSTELDKLKQGRKKIIDQYKQKEDNHE